MSAHGTTSAVSITVSVEDGRAVIQCGRCGVVQLLWTRVDLGQEGLAALFTEEHLACTPKRRSEDD
jgi:hypothetical protein